MNKASSTDAPVTATSETQNLVPGDSEDVFAFPLSYEQQRLWFLSQLVPGSAIYNVPIALRLKGRLHVEALRKALMEIVQRHEVLRTRFVTVEGEPMQLVEPPKGPFLELENLCGLPPAEREAEAIRRATEEANTPFDLSVGPMLRTKLLQLGGQEHVLLLTMHHIVSDAWSTAVLVREIATLYADFSHNRPSRLPDLSIQYADYAVWQREILQGPVLQKQVEYWRQRLKGLPVLELPTKGQRPARPSHLGAKLQVRVPSQLLTRLKELARAEDATLFMLLLASFQLLLSRWTGQQDLAVGTPVANRTRMETESLIGFFVNTLVLRTDFSGSPNVRELVKQVREVCSDAYAHQDLPFDRLVEELNPHRELAQTVLFQVMFGLQSVPIDDFHMEELTLEPLSQPDAVAKFDLHFLTQESEGGLDGSVTYATELFEAATIDRMFRHWKRLLESMVANPNQAISDLQMLGEEEIEQILVDWNRTEQPHPEAQCIQELFEAQVDRSPTAIAILFEDQQLNYHDLNERANQLAHYLRELGVGPDIPVGLCVERSLEMAVGLLGILKSGGTYVPLDPDYPADRLAYMLKDAQSPVLITQGYLGQRMTDAAAQIVNIDDWAEIAKCSRTNPPVLNNAENAAYVIYTSGSTGRPKGVVASHRGLMNTLMHGLKAFAISSHDVMAALASFAFDISLLEMMTAWLGGGATLIVTRMDVRDVDLLLDRLKPVTVLHTVPSLMGQIIKVIKESAPGKSPVNLRSLLIGGDQVSADLLAEMHELFPHCEVRVLYGPTEATIICANQEIAAGTRVNHSPIGRPITNMQLYLLDGTMRPAPIGVTGELYIAGAGLARGYLRRADLTTERFVPNPFARRAGERLYRTGDLGRWREDGTIEFIGRADQQVKIRGHRIELGEIECALREHAQVSDAVVISRKDHTGQNYLAAYVVAAKEEYPGAARLRAHVQQRLPEYMVPSVFVEMKALPLTPTGKLDRRALPAPETTGGETGTAARTPIEEILCGMWAKLLGRAQVGVEDNFFELGGHSLLATQVTSRARQLFGVEMKLQDLFEQPTVAHLAKVVEAAQKTGALHQTQPLVRVSRDGMLPLSFAQQRLWFMDQLEPGSVAYTMPLAVRLVGPLQIDALGRALAEIVRRHEVLRTHFAVADGHPVQKIEKFDARLGGHSLMHVDLSGLTEAEREDAMRQHTAEVMKPFDLSRGPLMRVRMLTLGGDDHALLLTMHHIIGDGWSLSVLMSEIAVLYEAFVQGQESPLPELEIQYADYASWQRAYLQGEVLERQLNYWRKQLADVPVLDLPTDRARPAVPSHKGAYILLNLPPELLERLKKLSRQEGTTLFMVLLAAFQLLLARYSGQEDIAVGTDVANRTRTEVESLIGFFVNQLVLRVNSSKHSTVRKLLTHVRQVCLGAYAHQDLPFERLVQEMNPERSLSHTPLFQVKVLLQNMPSSPRPFAGVEMKPLDLAGGVSQFDLLLSLQEAGDVLIGHCTYATDLFDEQTVLRIIGHWTRLLEEIAADPKRATRDLEMLSAAERRQVLVEWNGNRQESATGCVHEWFEQQVERTPRATAVICEDQHWGYADLNERANRLARHLQELGVGPEMRVGLCADRGLEMVVGILGILKAGGVYVPLDPGYPVERLAYMLEDAQIPVLLTQQALLGKLPSSLAQVVCLDSDWSQVEMQSGENLHLALDGQNAAYVIYTSGSTGKPKGVVVTHGGVVNLALAQIDKFAIREGSRVLQFASLSFDAAVSEWSTALLSGASLVVGSADRRWGATEVTRLAGEGKVSVVTLPPSVLGAFTEAELVGVETLVVAGEACSGELVRRWAAGRRMLNAYGPTETTVCASISHPLIPDGDCPIGVPIANMQVYVLDQYLQPAPIGVLGELYVGGAGLARGYLDRPDLTAERFVPNPYGGKAGERLYRTGDLGRWRGDGNLEFIRRADQQVKVRGYRIEPGEIEAALTGHPRVRDAVVIARVGESGQQRLVAYVVGREGKPPQAAELRTYLLSRLPEYMVPGLYVELEQMPLTANGKVDRQALPQPEKVRMKADREFKGPRTEVEKTLCEIWAKVLGLERVGVDDNFFELGGDSILSVQIVSRARESGLQLSVQQMFQYQTVAELAAEVQPVSAGSYLAPAPVIGEVPLTPIQSWFFEQVTAVPSHYNQSVMLTVPADLGPEVVEAVLSELLRNHDAFRLRFSSQADSPWQQRCEEWQPGPSMLERFDFSVESEQNRRALLEAEANRLQASLDLEKGPLLRAGWFELGRNERRLLLVVHHLAIDGVSWRILLGDLQTLCSQASANQPLRLAYQSASFGQWAQALQEHSQSEAMKGELEYWLQVVAHPAPPVRRDLDAGVDSMGSIAFVELRLSTEETQALLQQVPRAYHTQIQDVLLTALARGFEHWSGSKGLLLELEGHGREELSTTVDVSRTVGWFTTIFPVYLQLTGGGPGEDLKAVKEQLRAIPRHGIGYGILRYLTAQGRSSLKTQSEVVFNYLGQFDQLLSDGGWNSAPESPGAMQNATQKRSHLLEINGAITGGHLQLAFAYSRNVHYEETIRTLAAACLGELQALIAHCCSAEGSFTPSDFPLVRLTQNELDRISQGRKLEDLYPLSPMQEGMLFHTIEALGSGIYMSQLCLELEGAWDQVVFLRAAWEQVMKRHGVLRTSFVWEGFTRPLQRVEQTPELPWDNQDWRGLSTGEQRGKLEQYLQQSRTRGFDLAQAPLMRIGLVRIAEDRFYLVWTHHHLLLDGWSVARVLGEVQQFFDAYCAGEELQLPQPRPYRDYISWLERQDLECAEGFWRELLKDFSSSTQLGIERRHSKGELTSTRFGRKRVPLDRKLADELGALVHQQRLTLNTLMQAGWGLLLSRYSGQLDVIFGATTAARPVDLRGAEEIVGLFINTLPVRLRLQHQDSALDCLRRLQQEQIEARRYEYTPLVRIQSWSEVPPGQPLFQTLFVFESYPVAKPATGQQQQTGGMRALAASGEESTNYPLTATVMPGADLVLDIAYDRELFDAETVERMMGHWRRLLGAMVEHLEQPVLLLEMLDEAERQQVVVEWNRTAEEYRHACIHELVEEQAAKRPEALAVEYQGQGLSYGELNRRANQVGHYLRKLGIGPEVRVGICVERSLEMVIGLLGILKAGGAYVPLDPEYPVERLEYMVKDAQVAVLVTEKKFEEVLGQSATRKIYLEREWKEIEKESGADIGVKLDGGNPAYVIYTSGSTGRPKGVVIQHGALSAFLHGMNAQAGFNFGHTHLAVTTIGFDISILELFLPLCCGGRVVVASKEEAQDPAQLCRRLRSLAVNSMQATPSHWSMVLQADLDSLKGLRILCGGEALSRELAQSLHRTTQGQAYNVYGPTEATIWASSHKIKDTDFTQQAPPVITIGSPLANYRMYVLDGRLEPCPIGVAGGLYIAGSGLALGYLNRPELTAECFVPNPFSEVGGERIYRTGDQARWQADGNLEFQGRLDHQVKLRGYRIELAEIEAALLEHATVKQAIVVAREDAAGKRLVGYVVGEDGAGAHEMDLRGYLRGRLPEYMVPAVIVQLDEMPLTPNGKVDRRRLPEPEYSSRREQMAPRNVEEEILCGIFAEVLKQERVGVEDSFFELGGHSLLAMQVISRVRSAFGVELPIRALFEAQTVAALANRVKQERGEIEGAEPVVRDLGVEAILDANIVPLSQTPAAAPPENVFLTGASGFLGCFLLVELLKRTQATVHCLVRSSTPEEGAARISAELKSFGLWDAAMADRIVAVSGDLSRPRLGLSIEQFETIANIVDAVYHCGAIVNAAYSYDLLKPANVLGTQEIIRMACLGRRKVLHYISTTAVVPPRRDAEETGPDTEEKLFERWQDHKAGYPQSKWVAEKLVRMAGSRGVPVAIYRPPYISGFSQNGAGNSADFLSLFIRACLQLGCVPEIEDVEIEINMLPVDYVGRAIVALSLREDIFGRCSNLLHDKKTSLKMVCECLVSWGQASGSPIQRVSFEDWWRRCNASDELRLLRIYFPGPTLAKTMGARVQIELDTGSTDRLLQAEGIERPRITEELLKRYIAYGAKQLSQGPIVARGREARGEGKETAPPLVRATRKGDLPLSYAQQRLWFLDQLQPGNTAYNMPAGIHLEGQLDRGALEKSFQELVRRHEVLRTSFVMKEGVAVQVIAEEWKLKIEERDVRGLGAEEREAETRRWAGEEAGRPFDLGRGPLLRVKLLQVGEQEYVLLVIMHHIVSDGWSVGIMMREFSRLYEGYVKGEEAGLPELKVQYADYAVWQREWLQGEVLERQIGYWRKQLAEVPVLEMPTDYVRGAEEDQAGGTVEWAWGDELGAKMKELGRREGVTPYMILLAGYQAVLCRYTGQEDIAVGTPAAGRTQTETEGLIGFFVNTLVLRSQMSKGMSFRELLGEVRERVLEGHEHQEVPFEKLVEELQPKRDLARSPLFQVMFSYVGIISGGLQLVGLKASGMKVPLGSEKFEMTLSVRDEGGRIEGSLSYRTTLFAEESMRRLLGHYKNLMLEMMKAPERAMSDLAMMGPEERQQVVKEWNQTAKQYRHAYIHELVEEQAARRPGARAVEYEGQGLNYGELNRRANQVGHYLRRLGVGPEVRVGICMERNLEMVIGLLGILKAGGAYVPLDPEYPAERLEYMVKDAQAAVLVTERKFEEVLGQSAARKIYLEQEWREIEKESGADLGIRLEPQHLAYVIYTSGSTGKPKGVGIAHQSANVLMQWAREVFSDEELDGVLASTSICFDLSVFELFVPLSWGGRVVLAKNVLALPQWKESERVRLVNTVPSAMAELVRNNGVPASVRVVSLAGEALHRSLVEQIYEQGRVNRVLNLYGPTEDTTYSTWVDLPRSEDKQGVSIGRPLANTQAYVLGEGYQPQPVGVGGELYLGGAGLARGYMNQAGLTAERFVPNPFSEVGGERLYRTGDRAKWRRDGALEFMGRLDQQVKVRGYRIELGEIEAALLEHTGVEQAVVVVREHQDGDKRLAAYVVVRSAEAGAEDRGDLRSYLRGRLPEYMVPAVIVEMDEMPLTPNGKVDRKKLPEPEYSSPQEQMGPRNAEEEIICGIFAEVLKREQVGVEESFFELGGHSLLAMQVISRIRSAFAVELPLRALFEARTAAEMAHRVKQARGQGRVSASPLVRVARGGDLPLSYAQQRLWFLDQLQPGNAAYNIPIGIHLEGQLDRDALEKSFQELVRRHEVLRTSFVMKEGVAVQVIAEEWKLKIEERDVRGLGAEEREAETRRWAGEEAGRPFDLGRGPLLRVKLLQVGEQEYVLLVIMHHIVSDGWSVGIMMREFSRLYEGYVKGEEAGLPELKVQYADYAVWQREWLQGEVLERQIGYWRKQLAEVPVLEMPTDYVRGAEEDQAGGTVEWAWGDELGAKMKELGRREGVTPYMILLAGYQAVLCRYTGQEDIAVGTPVAGRTQTETEGLIGFFVNTLVLRSQMSKGMSFRELLGEVRERVLEGHEHQEVPFEKLVEELQPKRDLARSPLFQVMFSYVGIISGGLQLVGLKASEMKVPLGSEKFEMTLLAREEEGRVRGSLSYRTSLFSEESMRRLLGHYENLMLEMVKAPERAMNDLAMMGPEERQQVVKEWNQTAKQYRHAYIHELVEEQAARRPDERAVEYDGQGLSYGDLNRRANQVGHYLRKLGVGPEVRVGICMERSLEMVIGLLGILKAGGAYVPLDPEYPAERLEYMVTDAQAAVLVTERKFEEMLGQSAARKIYVDEKHGEIGVESEADLGVELDPHHLAYVIYTSGSTGKPKGVGIAHQSANVLMQWARGVFSDEELDGVLASTSICFDVSVFELFVPLSWGGRVVLAKNVLALPQWKEGEKVRLVCAVPSAMAELVRNSGVPASVRVVNLGGEAVHRGLVEQIYEQGRVNRVLNLYGPTEDTTYSIWAELPRSEDKRGVSIGRPLANTQAYVLGEGYQPQPVGVEGELYLGGAGLARGYMNQARLTAERFVPNPFSEVGGERMYRTGDRVKWRGDGNLEFMGRLDHQVKVRGYRIELGEIESALLEHTDVEQAAVVARKDGSAEQQVVAYVVGKGQAGTLTAKDLRSHLKQHLPEYMVPSTFVQLEHLPLTPNGKLDRNGLPSPAGSFISSGEPFVAPRNGMEKQLADIWEDLLGKSPISVTENFFDLGGHSMLAIRLAARVQKQLGKSLPLAALFKNPTVEKLVQVLHTEAGSQPWSPLVPIQPQGSNPPLFFVHAVGGHVLSYLDLGRRLAPGGQPLYGLQSRQGMKALKQHTRLEEMASEYVEAITAFQPVGPYRLGGWSMGGVIAFEMARQMREQGKEVEFLALIDSYPPSTAPAETTPEQETANEVFGFAFNLGLSYERVKAEADAILALSPSERLSYLLSAAQDAGLLTADVTLANFGDMWDAFITNFRILRHYRGGQYPGTVTLFRAERSFSPEPGDRGVAPEDPQAGWKSFAMGGVETIRIPGNHFTMIQEPQVGSIAEQLLARLGDTPAEQQKRFDVSQNGSGSKPLAATTRT